MACWWGRAGSSCAVRGAETRDRGAVSLRTDFLQRSEQVNDGYVLESVLNFVFVMVKYNVGRAVTVQVLGLCGHCFRMVMGSVKRKDWCHAKLRIFAIC